MPSSIRFAAVPARWKQGFRHLAALGGQRGQNLLLVGDPIPVLLHEGPESLLSGRTIGQLGEGVHAKLNVRDLGRGDELDLGRGNPARPGGVARAFGVDLGMRRDAMSHGILVDVAILQIGDALVPLLGRVALEVGSGNQRLGRVDGQPGLEDESLVTQLVRARDTVIDQEDGDGARPVRNHPLGDPQGLHGADRDGHAQTVAARDVMLDGLGGFGREIQGHLHAMGLAPPAHAAFAHSPRGQDSLRRPPGRPGVRPGNRPS